MTGGLFGELVFYGLAAAAAAPVAAVVTAFILGQSARPLPSSAAFVAGAALLDFSIALFLLLVIGPSMQGGDIGAYIDIALGVIFLILGIQAIFAHESPEQEAAQRARVERLATARLATMIGAGVIVQVINIDAVAVMAAGLKEIVEAGLSGPDTAIALVFLVVLMLLPYWLPAVAFAISPARARPALTKMTEWVLANVRKVEIVTGLGFGAAFLLKGLSDLLG